MRGSEGVRVRVRVRGSGFRVRGSEFRVRGSGSGLASIFYFPFFIFHLSFVIFVADSLFNSTKSKLQNVANGKQRRMTTEKW
jgi:hypothetical protein